MIAMRRAGLVLLVVAASSCGGGDGITVTGGDKCAPVAMAFPGSKGGSLSPTGCVLAGFPTAVYRFTATGSGGTTFNVTSSIPATIEVQSDPPGNDAVLVTTGASPAAEGEWMLPAGSFLFKVKAQSSSGNGTFTITGSSTNGATNNGSGCTDGVPYRLMVVGGTYSGQSLNTGDCLEFDASYIDYYIIRSLKACTVTFTPTGFDAYLGILDVLADTAIAIANQSGTGVAEHVDLPACSTPSGDPIEIEANTFSPGETGTYSLSIVITGGGSIRDGAPPADGAAILSSPLDVQRLIGRPRRFAVKQQ
jgi:hypothetical protein